MARKPAHALSPTIFCKKFGAGMTVRDYRDKEVVFSQGDTADAVFYVQSGTVKLTAVSTRRKKAIIAFLQRGSFFGEGCLGGRSLRICTARSIGPSNIIRLRKQNTMRTLERDPQFAALFVEYLRSRIIRIEEDLVDQFFNFSERRLARVLLLLGQITKESKPEYALKVSQSRPGGDGWYHPCKDKQIYQRVQEERPCQLQRQLANKWRTDHRLSCKAGPVREGRRSVDPVRMARAFGTAGRSFRQLLLAGRGDLPVVARLRSSHCQKWNDSSHACSATIRSYFKPAGQFAQSFAHAGQTHTAFRPRVLQSVQSLCRYASAEVLYLQDHGLRSPLKAHPDGRSSRVSMHVCQALLQYAEKDEFHPLRQPPRRVADLGTHADSAPLGEAFEIPLGGTGEAYFVQQWRMQEVRHRPNFPDRLIGQFRNFGNKREPGRLLLAAFLEGRNAYFQRGQRLAGRVMQVARYFTPLLILHLKQALRKVLQFRCAFQNQQFKFGVGERQLSGVL
jgi:CRP/FNR family transcriptional regulator, cyclic AMP receptor protein